jgi:hypothetical protein
MSAPMGDLVRCACCGREVEEARRCYASPTCYACLPPPEPLPVREVAARIRQPSKPVGSWTDQRRTEAQREAFRLAAEASVEAGEVLVLDFDDGAGEDVPVRPVAWDVIVSVSKPPAG